MIPFELWNRVMNSKNTFASPWKEIAEIAGITKDPLGSGYVDSSFGRSVRIHFDLWYEQPRLAAIHALEQMRREFNEDLNNRIKRLRELEEPKNGA